ncbi:MAG: ABC transporter ATP-binding protein [Desulfobacteraceae bacterium]|nr:MAG: ABC transporter ATP-binding protein [Desulfobacteraceae bacterium]
MLSVEGVAKNFGGVKALSNVTVSFEPGEFVGLIGPNGSGKTTLLNCISGIYSPDSGAIRLGDTPISRLRPHRIFRLGIGRTFQVSKVFNRLTVLQNVSIPALTEGRIGSKAISRRALEILEAIKLDHLMDKTAESLSGGQRKLLEIGMIMMTDPRFLLLDEPFGGVHPELKNQLESYLVELHRAGKTIILVSHEIPSVFRLCQRLVVLDRGTLIIEGTPESVRADERVIHAYLGGLPGGER